MEQQESLNISHEKLQKYNELTALITKRSKELEREKKQSKPDNKKIARLENIVKELTKTTKKMVELSR